MAKGSRPLSLRLSGELWARLEGECVRRGVDKSAVVRDALEAWLVRELPLVSRTGPAADDSAVPVAALVERSSRMRGERAAASAAERGGSVDLATWLAGRTGAPKALLRQRMSAGRVTVDGRPVFEGRVEKGVLRLVELDGERV